MEPLVIVVNTVFYIILAGIFIFIIKNEKIIGEYIKRQREEMSELIIEKYKISVKEATMEVVYPVHGVFLILSYGIFIMRYGNVGSLMGITYIVSLLNITYYIMLKKGKIKKENQLLFPSVFLIIVSAWLINNFIVPDGANSASNVFYIFNIIFTGTYLFTKPEIIRKAVDIFELFFTVTVMVVAIQTFFIGNFLVPTGSMIPTIMPGDRVFGNMFIYKFKMPQRGEVVLFKEPMEDRVLYTKRVVGLPGEKVRIGYDKKVYVNGKLLTGVLFDREYLRQGFILDDEWTIPKKGDFIRYDGHSNRFLLNDNENGGIIYDFLRDRKMESMIKNGQRIEIKDNYYFVLGDNSASSLDSRWWGFVAEKRIKGQPFLRIWPLNRIGLIK